MNISYVTYKASHQFMIHLDDIYIYIYIYIYKDKYILHWLYYFSNHVTQYKDIDKQEHWSPFTKKKKKKEHPHYRVVNASLGKKAQYSP